ncbi:MAG: RsmD family RNA methyltransferase, partial [Paludibacteraceae bacterium]|nr:RsmD family RNA methyltransferase [Paludibacteraceae bacterium]
MRIISGSLKGRRLNPPTNITARPTTDMAKESLFNNLNNRIDFEGIEVLDLFAGTGGIGLEFISRGARSVVAVEQSSVQTAFIRKACQQLQVDNLTVMRGDVFRYLRSTALRFDLIFADPPYALPELPELPGQVLGRDLLKSGGLFILEHPGSYSFADHPCLIDHRQYGKVNFSLF